MQAIWHENLIIIGAGGNILLYGNHVFHADAKIECQSIAQCIVAYAFNFTLALGVCSTVSDHERQESWTLRAYIDCCSDRVYWIQWFRQVFFLVIYTTCTIHVEQNRRSYCIWDKWHFFADSHCFSQNNYSNTHKMETPATQKTCTYINYYYGWRTWRQPVCSHYFCVFLLCAFF